jgi:hypothetical protein
LLRGGNCKSTAHSCKCMLNLLRHSGKYIHHLLKNSVNLHFGCRVCLLVLCGFKNNQQLFL